MAYVRTREPVFGGRPGGKCGSVVYTLHGEYSEHLVVVEWRVDIPEPVGLGIGILGMCRVGAIQVIAVVVVTHGILEIHKLVRHYHYLEIPMLTILQITVPFLFLEKLFGLSRKAWEYECLQIIASQEIIGFVVHAFYCGQYKRLQCLPVGKGRIPKALLIYRNEFFT